MKKIFGLLIFSLWSFVMSAQIAAAPVDTTQGIALVVVEYTVSPVDGDAYQAYSLQVIFCMRTRQETDAVKIGDPTGQLRAFITNYFNLDGSLIPTEDVLLFQKRD